VSDRTSPDPLSVLGADGATFAAALAETTESLVCVLDREGRILLFNEACERATGRSRDEVLGRDARELVIPPEDVEAFGGLLEEIWTTGLPSPQVGYWLARDGGRRLIAWSNRPVTGDDGTPLYLVTTGIDITELERAEAQRRALEGDLEAKLVEVGRLAREQAALRRVATLVAAEASPSEVFATVSEECTRVVGGDAGAVLRYEDDSTARVVGRYDRLESGVFGLDSRYALSDATAIGRVHASGRPARVDDYSDLPEGAPEEIRRAGLQCTVAAPITAAGAVWGAVAVTTISAEQLPEGSEQRLGAFAELLSLGIDSAYAREELRASRARIYEAADAERRRLERNLHDGAQQRLVSLGIALRLAKRKLTLDPDAADELVGSAIHDLEETVHELRELARGLHPAILSERGLRPALGGLVQRTPLDAELLTTPEERLPANVEAAAYYVVAEAMTNVARHAGASRVTVAVRREGDKAVVEIADDGRGGADEAGGSGLVGLRDRVDALAGTLTVESPPGAGTVVRATFPLL
jgi:PAS domain S-box-containing protein